jgi:hypothetical protein
LAAKPSNLIPRRKGESDAEFIKRIHSRMEAKKHGKYGADVKAAAKRLEARKELERKASSARRLEAKKEAAYRRQLMKASSRPRAKSEPIKYRKVTRAVEVSNPLRGGQGFRRVQERVKA